MRDCENAEIRDLLPDHAHGALNGVERSRVEAHLAACESCRAELALLRAVRAAHPAPAVNVARIVASLPRPGAAPDARAAATSGVVSLETHRVRRAASGTASGLPWRRVAAAAVIVVAVGAGLLRNRGTHDATVPDPRLIATTASASATASQPATAPEAGRGAVAAAGSDSPSGSRTTRPSPRLAPRGGDTDALGALGGIASDASDDELEALIGGLESLSGIPDVEAIEAEQSGGRGNLE
jgi:anti-sigma factor RsiW